MKKLLVLTLALIMLLGLAAPALAYTNNVDTGAAGKYKISLMLIEYNTGGNLFFSYKSKPTNRAYATNEIVAAVGSVTIPKEGDIYADGYENLQFKAKNMTFNVTENQRDAGKFMLANFVDTTAWGTNGGWTPGDDYSTLTIELKGPTSGDKPYLPVKSSKKTYDFLVFAKITKDNARLTFQSVKQVGFKTVAVGAWTSADAFNGFAASQYLVLSDDYIVFKTAGNSYSVFRNNESGTYKGTKPKGDLVFRIVHDTIGRTTELHMFTKDYDGPTYRVHPEPSNKQLIFIAVGNTVRGLEAGQQVKPGSSSYKTLVKFYERHFEKGLGFSAFNQGNIMKDKDWINIADGSNLSASVDLDPWVPYPTA